MFRAPYPAHLPHFNYVLDNVPGSFEQKARLLNIAPATLRKYRKQGQAPRPIHLALFWESVWGISTIETTAANQASRYFACWQAAKRDNARLVKQMLTIEQELSAQKNGAANGPIFQIG
ncbi:hypothetical protein KUF54_07200 [Comamonas sp. Y33R10-2]|uniref:hypothetical protein n=1 Tax=Comamonas sp. Y33R10-2 TaxID=2853257 RepID=UPI001C5CAE21|nr:hypothetical protein [Comamonas sp. Y33R10-2]QXZ10971.1 hypothetical protein KUF54_07200 [Comamonas sp. Y33R10-2]